MKAWCLAAACAAAVGLMAGGARAASAPMTLLQRIPITGDGGGEFDHLTPDVKGHRLFVADEGRSQIDVIDLASNKLIATFGKGDISTPHSLRYRPDQERLYVVEGNRKVGAVKIYDTKTYKLIKNISLPVLADWSGYDPKTQYLYVSAMGQMMDRADSPVSIIDTNSGSLIGQFTLDDAIITAFAMDAPGPHIYTGYRKKNLMAVIDRDQRKVVATWPVTLGTGLGSEAIDTAGHRLFANTRSGQMIVFDTQSGKELQAVKINTFSDDIYWDAAAKRIYITAKGDPKGGHASIEVIQQLDSDHYRSLGEVAADPGTRTGIYVPELKRFYAAAPKTETTGSAILVYQVK